MSYHLYISHVRSSAQDQVTDMMTKLNAMLPGSQMFMGVVDVEQLDRLEMHMHASQCVLIYLSKGYFNSDYCLRELDCALRMQKPLLLVHEAGLQNGGEPLGSLQDEYGSKGRDPQSLFGGDRHEIIAWHRMLEFKQLSLKLIAQGLLHVSPTYKSSRRAPQLYLPGEIGSQALGFPKPVCLYASRFNPGAAEVAEELSKRYWYDDNLIVVHKTRLLAGERRRMRSRLVEGVEMLNNAKNEGIGFCAMSRSRTQMPPDTPTHILVYLNQKTFTGEGAKRFESEIISARTLGLEVLVIHENDEERDGCPFSRIVETTPESLLSTGMYKGNVVPFQPQPHRLISLGLCAKVLGAVPQKIRNGFRSSTAQGSSSRHASCFEFSEFTGWLFSGFGIVASPTSDARHAKNVKVFDGFEEISARLVFPYSNKLEHLSESMPPPVHMTVLATGEVENRPKEVILGGVWLAEELEQKDDKELGKLLEKMTGTKSNAATPRPDLLEGLRGKPRDPSLPDKALLAFPQLQSMPPEAAAKHENQTPNSQFVWRRKDNTYAVVHCWPTKFNEHFRSSFTCSEDNPKEAIFNPQAAAEFRESMRRTFGAEADKVPLFYASKTTRNPYLALTGKRDALIAFLTASPDVQEAMGICAVKDDGFVSSIQIKGKVTPQEPKYFRMPAEGELVIYLKTGFEKMACTKPLHLFTEECALGPPLELGSNVYKKVLQTTAQYNNL